MRILLIFNLFFASYSSLNAQWGVDFNVGKVVFRRAENIQGPCDLQTDYTLTYNPVPVPYTSYKETFQTGTSLTLGVSYRLKRHLFAIGIEGHWAQLGLESYIDPNRSNDVNRCDTVGLAYIYRRRSDYLPLRYAYKIIQKKKFGIDAQLSHGIYLNVFSDYSRNAKLKGVKDFNIETQSTNVPSYWSLSLRPYVKLGNSHLLINGGFSYLYYSSWRYRDLTISNDFTRKGTRNSVKADRNGYVYFDLGIRYLFGKKENTKAK